MISHLSSAKAIRSTLGGVTLFPGVYYCTTYCTLDGTLRLDAQGDPTSVFQIITVSVAQRRSYFSRAADLLALSLIQAGYLEVAPAAQVVLANGASAMRVFWTLGAYAELGPASVVVGCVMSSRQACIYNTSAS